MSSIPFGERALQQTDLRKPVQRTRSHARPFALHLMWLVTSLWLEACAIAPDYGQTEYRCPGDGPCPSGFACDAGVCEREGAAQFNPGDASPAIDSDADAMGARDAADPSLADASVTDGADGATTPPEQADASVSDASMPDEPDAATGDPCADGGPGADAGADCSPLPRSCLELLESKPGTPDGSYEIDPDGAGPIAPLTVFCAMTAGGWTEIYREDFSKGRSSGWRDENGAPTPVDSSSDCAAYASSMLGGYNILGKGFGTKQTFALRGIPHTEVSLRLDYFVIDSWDAEPESHQDFALVFLDEKEVYRGLFDESYPRTRLCGDFFIDVGNQRVSATRPHTRNVVTVYITSTLDDITMDESYGIDNVVLRIR